jgi:hypothetical protein
MFCLWLVSLSEDLLPDLEAHGPELTVLLQTVIVEW